jgi:hypothetical protein
VEDEARLMTDNAKESKITKEEIFVEVARAVLSFGDCTWETASDINDQAISVYHQIN